MSAQIIQFPEPKSHWYKVKYLSGGCVNVVPLFAINKTECRLIIATCGIFLNAVRY